MQFAMVFTSDCLALLFYKEAYVCLRSLTKRKIQAYRTASILQEDPQKGIMLLELL